MWKNRIHLSTGPRQCYILLKPPQKIWKEPSLIRNEGLLGKFVVCEMHTYTGRIDYKVETSNFIYLSEFKRDNTAAAALTQIDTKDYALPFAADSRKLFKIGVSFDSATRKLADWAVSQ